MKIFDPYIRTCTQSEDDLKNLHYFGTRQVVTTAHGGRHFETAADLIEFFEVLIGEESRRLRRCQLEPHVAVGVDPDARPRRAHPEVWEKLPEFLEQSAVAALGEVGVWKDKPEHWELFERQVRLAERIGPLPILVTPPDELKITMTYKMMMRLDKMGYPSSQVVMNGLDEKMLGNVVESGFCAGYPVGTAHNDPRKVGREIHEVLERIGGAERILLTTALRSSGGDLLGIPKAIEALEQEEIDETLIEKMVYGNAARLFS